MADDVKTIADIHQDPRNARAHNPRNLGTIEQALGEVGAARSIVIDEDGKILAGNATVEAAANLGIEKVRIVDADGAEIIAVRRRGLTEEQKVRLAYFDNLAAEQAGWNPDQVAADREQYNLEAGLFREAELDAIVLSADFEPAPEDFKEFGDDIEVEHRCPKCGYEWSGGSA